MNAHPAFRTDPFLPARPVEAPDPAAPQIVPPKATRFVWRDPSAIPTRRFIYARHYARGFVSVTAAPGGLGKSSLAIAEAISIGTSRNILGVIPWERTPVWYVGLEDPLEEYERRVAAVALHHRIPGEEIGDGLFLDSGRDQDFVVATETRTGTKIIEPIVAAMIENIRRHGIGVVIVDPFVACHAVSENDNSKLEKVTRVWAQIANETNCAVELVHHFRKSNGVSEPSADDVRGASAIIGAARSVRILGGMSKDDADRAGVKDRLRYFSVNYGKANLFPRSEDLLWRRMVSVSLGNGGGRPDDEIGVATPWTWPNASDGLLLEDTRKVQDAVAAGEWGADVRSSDWVGHPVAGALRLDLNKKSDKSRVQSLVRAWLDSGALKHGQKHDQRNGRLRPIVVCGERV